MQYTFYIEGADNVGKTTVINTIKQTEFISKLNANSINFPKYPSSDTYSIANSMSIMRQKYLKLDDHELDSSIDDLLVNMFLRDMSSTFEKGSNDDNRITIADRGFFSTYLYNYAQHHCVYMTQELDKFRYFVQMVISPKYFPKRSERANMNIIILNNNMPQNKLTVDESETVEFKKALDGDDLLQSRINGSISEIVRSIHYGDMLLSDMAYSNVHMYYVNIYDTDGVRKTSGEVANEVISIINSVTIKTNV